MASSFAETVGLLVGNSFPLSLVRRRVLIEPATVAAFRAALTGRRIFSFWGHASTLPAVNGWLGIDLTPTTPRPVVAVDPDTGLPTLEGHRFAECWVIAPEYLPGFRPAVGEDVPAERIHAWQVLQLTWNPLP